MEQDMKNIGIPLLESLPSGTTSKAQTLGNIIVSIVGTGVLGLPFAFRVAGWFAGALGVIITGISTYYCMLLLIQCREKLALEKSSVETRTYGDLGYRCMGTTGRYLTEFLILISQCGGAVAYLVFIGQNLLSIFKGHGLTFASYVFLLVPVEIGLSWIGSLAAFAPFSIFADICNALAMGIVLKDDIQQAIGGKFSFAERTAITSNLGGLPFAAGMAVFCFEGFGMTLSLQNSMKDRTTFPRLLGQAFAGITLVYVSFGFFGYMAYGDQTRDIVTHNLPRNWSSVAVQVGLCLGLVFTFPVMLRPINEIVEEKLSGGHWCKKLHNSNTDESTIVGKIGKYISRAVLVVLLALLASCVPQFGVFASLVGSTVCALISFVLPATFHLRLFGSSLHLWQKLLDSVILSFGLLFAAYGTYNTVFGV
ncbi:putative Amino acid transporter [Quillaja saponaria]|uniref:Amino acid transporter n=1 Tax=Quillaja saponaria TaxID=32244 RepID=A0AAD7PY74_QUISA|nr:putative Amino acid transporter [Quillaja saponaria]